MKMKSGTKSARTIREEQDDREHAKLRSILPRLNGPRKAEMHLAEDYGSPEMSKK